MSKLYTWYTVAIREPSWSNAVRMWDRFTSIGEAEDYLKDLASTYPEGTLVFIISNRSYGEKNKARYWNTAKSWVVDEYGQLAKRQRRWVPDESVPVEWIKELPKEPESIATYLEKFEEPEKFRAETIIGRMGLGEGEKLQYEDRLKKGWFRPSELEKWK